MHRVGYARHISQNSPGLLFTTVVNNYVRLMRSKEIETVNTNPTKYKLSACGQVTIDRGATPPIDPRMIKLCPAKIARGAYKPKGGRRGDAPTIMTAANLTSRVCENSQHDAVRKLAARGWK
jgi:hypothetical protein